MRKCLAVLAAGVVVLSAACGSSSKSSSSNKVDVKITSKGCEPATLTLPPGETTFVVTNDGAASITEFELKRGDKIVGEKENLTPGLSGDFTVTLKPGEYETECPGGQSGKVIVSEGQSGTTAVGG
jgi:iron uptake system component EfeO